MIINDDIKACISEIYILFQFNTTHEKIKPRITLKTLVFSVQN